MSIHSPRQHSAANGCCGASAAPRSCCAAPATKNRISLSLGNRTLISAVFTIPLWLGMFLDVPLLHSYLFQFLLALPVIVIAFQTFAASALASIKNRHPNMGVLVLTGVSASFVYSILGWIGGASHEYLFFETASSITTFVLFGHWIEELASKRTESAIEELVKLQSTTVSLLKDGKTIKVPSAEVSPDSIVLIREGDRIPLDCYSVDYPLSLDESIITGESTILNKKPGDTLLAGSLVISGNCQAKVLATEGESMIARLIKLVQQAQLEKPEIQRLGDTVSAYFVPAVIIVALMTVVFNFLVLSLPFSEAIMRAIAVLVIACPCAMGLATPTAIFVATSSAARNGILIKSGKSLEALKQIGKIIFDKTGTLTEPSVQIQYDSSVPPRLVDSMLVGLEQRSSHPLARSILAALPETEGFKFTSVIEQKGQGIFATDSEGKAYFLGSPTAAQPNCNSKADIVLLQENKTLAELHITETLRSYAKQAVSFFSAREVPAVLLSGDSAERCQHIASQLKIEKVFSRQTPEAKLHKIAELQQGQKVAFVGDGINDAPALSKANLGIALSDASAVSQASADIILLGENLSRLPMAYRLSELTLKTIRQNLFWAFFYNIAAIPVAALGGLTPTLSALTMAFSDVIVVGNSLRIRPNFQKIVKMDKDHERD
jgi:Cu+-exporting ATPase